MKNCVMYKGFAILGMAFLFILGILSVAMSIKLDDVFIYCFRDIILASLALTTFSNINLELPNFKFKTTGKRTVWTEEERARRLAKKT